MDPETAKELLKQQRRKAKNKAYYDSHKDHIVAKKREQYDADARKTYYETNKEKLKLNKAMRQHEEILQQTKDRLNNLMKVAQPSAKVILERMLERLDTKEGLSREAILGIEMLILTAASINDKPLPVPQALQKPEQWVIDARECHDIPVTQETQKEQ
jgi:hypothetical protein